MGGQHVQRFGDVIGQEAIRKKSVSRSSRSGNETNDITGRVQRERIVRYSKEGGQEQRKLVARSQSELREGSQHENKVNTTPHVCINSSWEGTDREARKSKKWFWKQCTCRRRHLDLSTAQLVNCWPHKCGDLRLTSNAHRKKTGAVCTMYI